MDNETRNFNGERLAQSFDERTTPHPSFDEAINRVEQSPPAVSKIDQAINQADDLLKKTEELAKSWSKPTHNTQPVFEMTIRQHVALSILCSMVQSQACEYPTPAMVGTSYTLADLFIHKGQS
jgi:hypothetical protein